MRILISILLTLSSILNLYAIKAYPWPVTEVLPDGSSFTYQLKGDEYFKYKTTTDGYLLKKTEDGYFEYATYDSSKGIKSLGIRAHQKELRKSEELGIISTLTPDIDFTEVNISRRIQKVTAASAENTASSNAFPKTGSPKSLVILVNFKDKAFVIDDPKTNFTELLNAEGYSENGGTGSARDYFISSSFGQVSPSFDVVGPYTLPSDMNVYGANDASDNDINPRQMVIDACTLADKDVNFADYDLDNDGIIDNVFIYYAGYNEAEGASENTIWPHRWAVTTVVRFDNKRLFGYACTSELKGSTGSTMCGIGTFCHEFGHVFGLVDYYPTDGGTHQTLSFWNIMDSGSYLNSSRTPPTYSAYDRFYLGWLSPTLLSQPATRYLTPLQETNKAYIITATGQHNLIGWNPDPKEFFTLENRQKSGWDSFLPYHGMLITRINYDANLWDTNEPNNLASAMRVDLMEADGYATSGTLTGDPFPGSRNIKNFIPELMNGTKLSNYFISNITEVTGGDITLDFMGGGIVPYLTTSYSPPTSFNSEYLATSEAQVFTVSGENLIDYINLSFEEGDNFEMKLEEDANWSKTLRLNSEPTLSSLPDTRVLVRFNPTIPDFSQAQEDKLWFVTENAESKSVTLSGTINNETVNLFQNFDKLIKVYREASDIIIDMREKTDIEYPVTIRIYDSTGRNIYNASSTGNFHTISGIPKNRLLILEIDGYSLKLMN